MNVLSFDTGKNIGWSLVDTDNVKLLSYGFKEFELSHIQNYCDQLICWLHRMRFDVMCFDIVRIELPVFYGDKKGTISLKKGDLFYVHACAIAIYSHFKRKNFKGQLVTPNQWKGQLTKVATESRVKYILKDQVIEEVLKLPNTQKEHILDSIGIGLSSNSNLWNLRS